MPLHTACPGEREALHFSICLTAWVCYNSGTEDLYR